MLSTFLILLISATVPVDPAEARFPEAVEVLRCRFDADSDKDFDTWPDGWTRQKGYGHPAYTKIQIQPEASPGGANCLRIDLNGGGAAVFTPPIPMNTSYSYELEAYLRTEGLKRDGVYLSLTFLDADKHTLSTAQSEPITNSRGWEKIRLGTAETSQSTARWIVVGLHVEPGDEADLHGTVCFSDVWLGRLPRLQMKTNQPHNFFLLPDQAKIACTASGLDDRFSAVTFELLDVFGQTLVKETRPLNDPSRFGEGEAPAEPLETPNSSTASTAQQEPSPHTITPIISLQPNIENPNHQAKIAPSSATALFTSNWTPPLPGAGFYRIRIALEGKTQTADRREITLVAVEPRGPQPNSIFGWSLPQGSQPFSFPELPLLLEQAGIGWVKVPVWCSEQDGGRRLEQILLLIDKLNEAGIHVAGMLLEPPEPAREKFSAAGPLTAAEVFGSDPANWFPSLEPVMIQLSNKVRCWQLGRDTDQSLLILPNFTEKMKAIRAQLDRAMQGIRLSIGWNWLQYLPSENEAANLPWNIVSLSSDPPLSESELGTYLENLRQFRKGEVPVKPSETPSLPSASRREPHPSKIEKANIEAGHESPLKPWVVLTPLAREKYTMEERAEDLVKRMLVAKIHGADAAFCPDPFDRQHGLMNPDGTPGELFLPWRTAALEIGGAEFLGEMTMPRGSRNRVFLRDADAVMFVWNHKPVDEVLNLGNKARQITLWGKSTELLELDRKQLVEVKPQPTFITGIDRAVAQWSVGVQLEKTRLTSVFGQALPNSFTITNPLPISIRGKATIVTPPDWIIEPKVMKFRCSRGEKLAQPFNIYLLSTVNSGRNTVRIDFEIDADRPYKFSVYRHLDVGTSDIRIEFQTRLNERNELEVEQRFLNDTGKPVNFRCELIIPGRHRLMTEIHCPQRAEETQIYRLENGPSLLGKQLWVRAEELDGSRMLNYRFEAEK